MSDNVQREPPSAMLGLVEPHAPLLRQPREGQSLYKIIMSAENLIRSMDGRYLHFNRVDSYNDLSNGDPHDGQQLPGDQAGNDTARFVGAPDFSGADYYDRCRSRTYACCFSLENSDYVWANYGKGGHKGQVGLVFDFTKLRADINRILEPGNVTLLYNGVQCHQIFSVNYGVINYVDWDKHRANDMRLPNPIVYTYLKDKEQYGQETELRISLSAIGMGQFVLDDRSIMAFPAALQMPFDFPSAFREGTIKQMLCSDDCDLDYLHTRLRAMGAEVQDGSPTG